MARMAAGIVERFDVEVGLGTITAETGDAWDFHCTTIADGTRTIQVGAPVSFLISAGGPGRWEAFAVTARFPDPNAVGQDVGG